MEALLAFGLRAAMVRIAYCRALVTWPDEQPEFSGLRAYLITRLAEIYGENSV